VDDIYITHLFFVVVNDGVWSAKEANI